MSPDDDLFARVVADLADDGPRAVLADHWLEHGELRGEFVALQLKVNRGAGTRTDRERMTELKKTHELEWLGALRNVAGFALYHRGFLDELRLSRADLTAAVVHSRELGTVRFLRRGSMLDEAYRDVLFSPALVNVQSADVPLELLDEVLRQPPPKLRHVAIVSSSWHSLEESVEAVRRILVEALFEDVTVSVPLGEDIREYLRAHLPLATETTGVVVSTPFADCKTSRTDGGLVLRVPKRDRRLLAAARDACPDARVV